MNYKKEAPAFLMFVISLTILVLSFYGLIYSPIIQYSIDTNLGYYHQIDSSKNNITVTCKLSNYGDTAGRGWIGLKFINFTLFDDIRVIKKESYDTCYIYYEVEPKQDKNINLTFNIVPNCDGAIIVSTINKDLTKDIVTNFFNSYCTLKSKRPTSLYFMEKSENLYQRADETTVDQIVSYLNKNNTWES